ncbi:MAG: ComEC/Rec2 family competence protein, partial [Eggerthella lenta]
RKLAGDGGVVGLRQGDALQVGSFDLQAVWPERFSDEGGNADSLCLVADADIDGDGASEWRALFTGDAERDQLRALIDEGLVDSVDLYKVGHHGSKNALDDEEAAVLSPRIALVSAGARNRYGHPAQDTLDRLEAAGARVFRTDEQGDVSCKLTADRIEVDTLR